MTEYDNTNRFTLFKNENKREGKKDADYQGTINVNGQEFWLNGWITNGKKGKFISGSIRPKGDIKPDPRITTGRQSADMDDEIPF